MTAQNLPTYIHEFLNYPNWITVESEHYIFNFTQGSAAEKDIEHIKAVQETAYTKIVSLLDTPTPTQKITYYFYPDADTKKKLMGDDWYALTIFNEWCIHVLYTEEDKPIGPHEDTHLLSLHLGQATPFIAEGLADFMVGYAWDGTPHADYVRKGIALGLDMNPEHYLTKDDWFNTPDEHAIIFYSLAASWTAFLIEKYSLDTYLTFYKDLDREMSREEVSSVYLTVFEVELKSLSEEYLSNFSDI